MERAEGEQRRGGAGARRRGGGRGNAPGGAAADDDEAVQRRRLLDRVLLPHLAAMAVGSGYDPAVAVDRTRAGILLEATAFDVDLAAQLYWDDFLVTQQRREPQPQEGAPPPPPPAEEPSHHRPRNEAPPREEEAPAAGDDDRAIAADDAARPAVAALPDDGEDHVRRLDGAFERAHREHRRDRPPAAVAARRPRPDPAANEAYLAAAQRLVVQARRLFGRRGEPDGPGPDAAPGERPNEHLGIDNGGAAGIHEMARAAAQRILAQPRRRQRRQRQPDVLLDPQQQETVSISDDETGDAAIRGLLETKRQLALSGKTSKKRPASENLSSANSKRLKQQDGGVPIHDVDMPDAEDHEEEEDVDEVGYLSDDDWIWDALRTSRKSIPVMAPMDLLWGLTTHKPRLSRRSEEAADAMAAHENMQGDAHNNDNRNINVVQHNDNNESIVIDDDEDVEQVSDNDNESSHLFRSIPNTWLNAGFQLDADALGLAIFPPREEDMGYFAWQTQQTQNTGGGARASSVPSPYHCRAITAVVSIVTALLHTGVCVRQQQIVCSGRRPFLELEKDARKREFHDRLADALSCLLFIAAKASKRRKETALRKLKEASSGLVHKRSECADLPVDPAEKRKWQVLEGKLGLCPTCTWAHDPDVRALEGPNAGRNLLLSTSYTNINDLRAFVKSEMRYFTSSGGVALLLENIIRFHGRGMVNYMISCARGLDASSDNTKCLIHCTCEELHKKLVEGCGSAAEVRAKFSNKNDTSPRTHTCLSTALLSLLLTGRVHMSFDGWSTGPLGFGLLSHVPGTVSKRLTRPEKPVWILRGETCYTTLWLDYTNERGDDLSSRVDRPGAIGRMTHWNSWYDERHITNFKMILHRESAPGNDSSKTHASVEEAVGDSGSKTMRLIKAQRARQTELSKQLAGTEPVDPYLMFTQEDLDRIIANPDDQKYYPHKYELWSFDMNQEPDEDLPVAKQRAPIWKPFYRLSDREKVLIEAKLGLKIKIILWSRWPRATIDSFEPSEPPPVV